MTNEYINPLWFKCCFPYVKIEGDIFKIQFQFMTLRCIRKSINFFIFFVAHVYLQMNSCDVTIRIIMTIWILHIREYKTSFIKELASALCDISLINNHYLYLVQPSNHHHRPQTNSKVLHAIAFYFIYQTELYLFMNWICASEYMRTETCPRLELHTHTYS